MSKSIAALLVATITAKKSCEESGNTVWRDRHEERAEYLMGLLPTGSGLDAGNKLDEEATTATKLVITTSFHHMDEHGGYDGWTDHQIVVTPAFDGIDIKITGRNRNQIKEYLGDLFYEHLNRELTPDEQAEYELVGWDLLAVEYNLTYSGGSYDQTGTVIRVPIPDNFGGDLGDLAKQALLNRGIEPVHMISYRQE